MRMKAKMWARDEDMKNEPKSLESVKERCMQCLFAVRPERWRRFRGVVYIGKGRRKKKEVKMWRMQEICPLRSRSSLMRSGLIKLSQSLMHGANPWRGEEMKKSAEEGCYDINTQ